MHLTGNKSDNRQKTCKYFPLGPYICKNKSILFAFNSNFSYDINPSKISENTVKVFYFIKNALKDCISSYNTSLLLIRIPWYLSLT